MCVCVCVCGILWFNLLSVSVLPASCPERVKCAGGQCRGYSGGGNTVISPLRCYIEEDGDVWCRATVAKGLLQTELDHRILKYYHI